MASYYDKMAKILHNDKIRMPKLVEVAARADIISAVSSYMKVDTDKVQIDIETNDRGEMLIAATISGHQLNMRNN